MLASHNAIRHAGEREGPVTGERLPVAVLLPENVRGPRQDHKDMFLDLNKMS